MAACPFRSRQRSWSSAHWGFRHTATSSTFHCSRSRWVFSGAMPTSMLSKSARSSSPTCLWRRPSSLRCPLDFLHCAQSHSLFGGTRRVIPLRWQNARVGKRVRLRIAVSELNDGLGLLTAGKDGQSAELVGAHKRTLGGAKRRERTIDEGAMAAELTLRFAGLTGPCPFHEAHRGRQGKHQRVIVVTPIQHEAELRDGTLELGEA